MVRSIVLAIVAGGCGMPPLSCGEGAEPVVVTGLSGTLDERPAVEIQARVPMDCQVVDAAWMFWDEEADVATLSDPPSEGVLERAGVTAGDRTIVFNDLDLGVRLEYQDAEVAGPDLTLVWFASGVDLSAVDCAALEAELACEVRAP